jgi:hypothetical protein
VQEEVVVAEVEATMECAEEAGMQMTEGAPSAETRTTTAVTAAARMAGGHGMKGTGAMTIAGAETEGGRIHGTEHHLGSSVVAVKRLPSVSQGSQPNPLHLSQRLTPGQEV